MQKFNTHLSFHPTKAQKEDQNESSQLPKHNFDYFIKYYHHAQKYNSIDGTLDQARQTWVKKTWGGRSSKDITLANQSWTSSSQKKMLISNNNIIEQGVPKRKCFTILQKQANLIRQ